MTNENKTAELLDSLQNILMGMFNSDKKRDIGEVTLAQVKTVASGLVNMANHIAKNDFAPYLVCLDKEKGLSLIKFRKEKIFDGLGGAPGAISMVALKVLDEAERQLCAGFEVLPDFVWELISDGSEPSKLTVEGTYYAIIKPYDDVMDKLLESESGAMAVLDDAMMRVLEMTNPDKLKAFMERQALDYKYRGEAA